MQNKITILGSGTCVYSFYQPFDFRYPSGYLLQYEGLNILIDCSEGIRSRLEQMRFDYFKISNIFISHFHPDHFSLDTFLQAMYVRGSKAKEWKKIDICGPKGIEEKFSTIWDLKHMKGHYQRDFKKTMDINFHELSDGKNFLLSDKMKVTAFRVPHGEMEAYAMRIDRGGNAYCYSGDSGHSVNLIKAAYNTELFICESALAVGENSKDNSHLNPLQAGEIAKKAKVKELVLTHYTGINSPEAMLDEAKKSGFSGKLTVGKDFQIFNL
ncbi:MBL fold metallo-hydrolase [Candidatus Roizmanbacteria bacterium]|nr:MBL fold metallo-hydrolase [Candidatus Roizmanbacteria bacterium]